MSNTDWAPVAHLLARRARERAEGVATFDAEGSATTWGAAAARADAVADAVRGAARVAIWMPNRADFASAVFGVWQAGATAVVVGALSSRAEAAALARATEMDRAVTTADRAQAFAGVDTVDVDALPTHPSAPPVGAPAPEDALVVFTSGTTGRPKGIVHGGGALRSSLRAMAASSGLDADDARPLAAEDRAPNLALTPLSHVSGLLGLLFSWWAGKPVVVFERFDPERLDQVVERRRVSTLRLVPAMVYDLVHAPASVHLAGVKYATSGTAALAPELARRFEQRFGFPILANYGQSEAMGGVASERLADVRAGLRPVGSVGRPLPGVDVRVVDPASGAPLDAGDVGEITVRSSQVMRRYVGDASGAPVDAEGYLHTGDLGRLDADGILSVVGRARDVIVSGGFNVYPAEVESVLAEAPVVDGVGVAAVDDERLGEVAVAAIVSRADLDPAALDALVREQLAPYKRPRGYVRVDALPTTPNGKLDRRRLAALVADRVAAAPA